MTFADVEAKTTISPLLDKAAILEAMRTAYNVSPTAKKMFDDYIATGKAININYTTEDNFFGVLNTGELRLNPNFLKDNTYITPTGKAVEDTLLSAIVHEFGHALKGWEDNWSALRSDYKGDNVNFVNKIYDELHIPEQISYIAYDSSGTLHKMNFEYTNGSAIDRAVTLPVSTSLGEVHSWYSGLAFGSRDLLIGDSSDNFLLSGSGNDFLFGGGGNDRLSGGGDNDTVVYMGKPTDYDIRYNPDGTWTSRHVRGAADAGTDTLNNDEKVQFEGGQTFDLKKEGLKFQTDFAFVIDTTGSMGDDIGAVKAHANTVIDALFDGGKTDARIGIVGFKDNTIGEPTSIILPFTDQDRFADRKAAAAAAINSITVGGGGDEPETAFDGLLKALNGSMGDWRPGAGVHRVALFTDASAKDASLAPAVAALAANIGATISSSAKVAGASGSLAKFELSFAGDSNSSARDQSTEPDTINVPPPPMPADDAPTPDTSKATVEIFTIFTGPDFVDKTALDGISETTGGDLLTAKTGDELVDILLDIIDLPPDGNNPPLAQDDAFAGNEDAVVGGNVLTNTNPSGADSDPDGDALTVSAVNGDAGKVGVAVTLASGAKVTLAADGSLAYDPRGAFDFLDDGETATDSFTYTVSDGKGGSDAATVTLTVAGRDERIIGTPAGETLIGTPYDDDIFGRGGNDRIFGLAGNDELFGEDGNDVLTGGLGNDRLDGGNGTDTASYRDASGGVTVDLLAGTASGAAGNDTLAGIENLEGGNGNDSVRGNGGNNTLAGGAGNDTVNGGAGNDRLDGGLGVDVLTGGGAGTDTFAFNAVAETGVNPGTRDIVRDFGDRAGDQDLIDLAAIDANPLTAANETFVFRGVAAFTAVGQVRAVDIGADKHVQINTDADREPEAVIVLAGGAGLILDVGDLIL